MRCSAQERGYWGCVSASSCAKKIIAWLRCSPHIAASGCRLAQTAGRPGWPKIRQRWSAPSCTQRTPAGLPSGIPGMALEIDGAVQQAPQPARQSMRAIRTIAASACSGCSSAGGALQGSGVNAWPRLEHRHCAGCAVSRETPQRCKTPRAPSLNAIIGKVGKSPLSQPAHACARRHRF